MIRRLLGVTLLLVVPACTSSSDRTATPTTLKPTTTTVATTTVATTTSTTTDSTTTTSEPEWTPEELEVIAAYAAFQGAWELGAENWDLAIEAVRATSAGDYGAGVVEAFESYRDSGSTLQGARTYEVRAIEFVGPDRVVLDDCGLGAFELVDANGAVIDPADTETALVKIFLEAQEGQWFVVGRRTQSSSC